jgi:hypothetical protein
MRHPMSASGTFMPQPPGRTPHRSALRLPAGETLLVRGQALGPPCLPEASTLLVRACGTTSREGGN